MSSIPSRTLDSPVGTDAAWRLEFLSEDESGAIGEVVLDIGREDYYGEIEAELPSGLAGGNYSFVVEGMTDEHYQKIAQGAAAAVRLHLSWRDTGGGAAAYLASVAGLSGLLDTGGESVAELAIGRVFRRAGARRYETVIEARERVFDKLADTLVCDLDTAPATALDQVRNLAEGRCGLTVNAHEHPALAAARPSAGALEKGRSCLDQLRRLERRLEQATKLRGRGLYLIRAGELHVGPRPIPLDGEATKLSFEDGLVEAVALDQVKKDPRFDRCADPTASPPMRRRFRLVAKGRPEIRPGDVVEFDSPPGEVPPTTFGVLGVVAGAVAGPVVAGLGAPFLNPVLLYVSGVKHSLGRTSGFVTEITGVEVEGPDDVWDTWTEGDDHEPPAPRTDDGASPESRVAQAVSRKLDSGLEGRRLSEVAEVRRVTSSGEDPPSQTATLWRGLAAGDGEAGAARRLEIQRPSSSPAVGVPYVSPFAWGRCGLVLPRYPGTRVVVTHRNGHHDDAIDLGALWRSGEGPKSEPGDWWLVLPVGVDPVARAGVEDDQVPAPHSGPVTQDLIDADGNRVIEVGELTVRVGRDGLKDAGERAERSSDDGSVTIEHADGGARIVMDASGKIRIEGKTIEIEATDGGISMRAPRIDVSVDDAFDVS